MTAISREIMRSRTLGASSKEHDLSVQQIVDEVMAQLADLPTADPHIVGRLWNDSGILRLSAGAEPDAEDAAP